MKINVYKTYQQARLLIADDYRGGDVNILDQITMAKSFVDGNLDIAWCDDCSRFESITTSSCFGDVDA